MTSFTIRPLVLLVAMALGVGTLPSRLSFAQDSKALSDVDRKKALEHYEKAKRLYDVGRYGEAIEEYQNVYLITADANMLLNIAQAYRLSEQLTEAQRFYKRYLSVAPPNAEGRTFSERKLAEVEKLIEERKKTGAAPPPVTPPTPPPVTNTAPPVTPPAPPPVTNTAPPPATAPPPVTPSDPAQGSLSVDVPMQPEAPSKLLPWTLVISGGVLLAASGGLAMLGQSRENQIEKDANSQLRFDPKVQKDGEAANLFAVVTGIAGLAATVTGIVLLVRSGPAPSPASGERTATTPPRPQAQVVPIFGYGFAGANARVVF